MSHTSEGTPRSRLRARGLGSRYFVPAFSVRWGVDLEDSTVLEMQSNVKRILGSLNPHFNVQEPSKVGMTVVEKSKLIENMHDAGARLSPEQTEDLALTIRDGLGTIFEGAPAVMSLPIGRLALFGDRRNSLGLQVRGWKGYFARRAMRDETGSLTAHGAIVTSTMFSVGAISAAMSDNKSFITEGLARTPHIQIASNPGGIRRHELREIERQFEIEQALPPEIPLTDPVINLVLERGAEPMPIYIRTDFPE